MTLTLRKLPLLCALLALWCAQAWCAGMTLSVESAKARYLVDEPLFLTITLTNTDNENVEHPVFLHPSMGFLTLYITEPGGKPTPYFCGGYASIMMQKHGKIFVPGEAVNTRMWMVSTNHSDGLSILAKPGTYTFYAQYNLPKDFPGGAITLRSSDYQIQVSEPTGAEKAAHKILLAGTHGAPWEYPAGKAARKAQMERFAKLVKQYPASVYAVYAQSIYASSFNVLGDKISNPGITREAQITYATQAMEQSRIYMEMAKGTPLETDALLNYGRACAILGKIESAARALETALLCPTATTDERHQALSWTKLLEAGVFREELREAGEIYPIPERTFPLLESARVFGFAVAWDAATHTATISNPRITATLPVGSNTITINGTPHTGALSTVDTQGQVRVSARTLGFLLELDWLIRPTLP